MYNQYMFIRKKKNRSGSTSVIDDRLSNAVDPQYSGIMKNLSQRRKDAEDAEFLSEFLSLLYEILHITHIFLMNKYKNAILLLRDLCALSL